MNLVTKVKNFKGSCSIIKEENMDKAIDIADLFNSFSNKGSTIDDKTGDIEIIASNDDFNISVIISNNETDDEVYIESSKNNDLYSFVKSIKDIIL